MPHPKTFSFLLISLGVFLLFVNLVWAWQNSWQSGNVDEANSTQYPLLSQRIFVDNPNDIFLNFVPLRKSLESKFSALNVPYSFYFEYLPNGTSLRIGEDFELVAASLTKLPYVMDLYRAAELGKIDLDEIVTLQEDWIDARTGILWQRGAGGQVTYREAAELALTHSDNTALVVIRLATHQLLSEEDQSLSHVNIELQKGDDSLLRISAKSFASVLKCLYFSCYLTWESSQEILSYLTQTVFDDRITRLLPPETLVAHKIGNFSGTWSVSDCGLVYVPQRPYILCVMVGLEDAEASAFIADVSREVFDHINRLNL